jgi:hypothetical protein
VNTFLSRSLALAAAILSAGGLSVTASEFDTALARASELKQPLIVLVAESGQSKADDHALSLLKSRAEKAALLLPLDLSVSRNRAIAARFHPVKTPLLLCLSSKGIVISRDENSISRSLLSKRIEEAARQAPALDAKLLSLEDAASPFDLTDFLIAHHNAAEAIPRLEKLAHAETNSPAPRLRAWVDLIRAHFWIDEPEKGRREAQALMSTLGTALPEARAAGEFALGSRDAELKRIARARTEFEAATAAAPDSIYGKQASEALASLPKEVRP